MVNIVIKENRFFCMGSSRTGEWKGEIYQGHKTMYYFPARGRGRSGVPRPVGQEKVLGCLSAAEVFTPSAGQVRNTRPPAMKKAHGDDTPWAAVMSTGLTV
ncbi:MAG: hypothetical protein WHT07_00140 [Desulfobaccales bacterium]